MKTRPSIRGWFVALLLMPAGWAASGPGVLLSLRGPDAGSLSGDLPLFVSVRVEAPAGNDTTIVLAPGRGNWSDGVRVELVTTREGQPPLLAQRVVGADDAPALTLDAEQAAEGVWLFPSAAIGALPPGDYQVRVELAIVDGSGWRGTAMSDSAGVKIVATTSGSDASPEAADRRLLARAAEAMALADYPRAAQLLDSRLSVDPDQVEFLKMRATLCLQGGNAPGASLCLDRAWDRVMREKWTHPPRDLHVLTQAVTVALLKAPESTAQRNWPEWSIPPEKVRRPVLPEKPAAPATLAVLPAPMPSAGPTPSAQPVATPPKIASVALTAPPSTNKLLGVEPTPTKPGAPSAGTLVSAAELPEENILADTQGQWAVAAVAGSQYAARSYTAAEATGGPNVPKPGDSPQAWCHNGASKGIDWIELTFANPVRATEVRVRQSLNPGTIVKVEAIEPDGTSHVWWEGKDPGLAASAGTIAWFVVRVPPPEYAVAKIKLTLDLSLRLGWKQIDAVQLSGVR